MNATNQIRTAQSCLSDARAAVREFHAGVWQAETALVVFFCSSKYDLDALADEMTRLFQGVTVVGCTTAGEIGPAGYFDYSLSGASFAADACVAVAGCLEHLQQFKLSEGQAFAQSLLQQLETCAPSAGPDNSFSFLLIDGLSRREEPVARALQDSLGNIPLFGGSAGDNLKLNRTWVYHDGAFHSDSAVLLLVSTHLPFKIFKTQHFVSESERMVVTEADISQRVVREINGLPAAEEYARAIGAEVEDLNPMRFAASPVVVAIDGTDYVRSIQKVNPDGSLTFFCAIDEGLVLRVVRGVDLLGNLEHTFDELRAEVGPPQLVFACDCILRNLELTQSGAKDAVESIFRRNNVVGFSTYGEQYRGVHVNQTLTGIALGNPRKAHDD
jgi:hypothetical protein